MSFQCFCGKTFSNSRSLKDHISSTKYHNRMCEACFKICKSEEGLERHIVAKGHMLKYQIDILNKKISYVTNQKKEQEEKNRRLELILYYNIECIKIMTKSINKIRLRDNGYEVLVQEFQNEIIDFKHKFNFWEIINQYQIKFKNHEIRSAIEIHVSKVLNNKNSGELIYNFLKEFL